MDATKDEGKRARWRRVAFALAVTVAAYAAIESIWLMSMKHFYAGVFSKVSSDHRMALRSTWAAVMVYPLLICSFFGLVLSFPGANLILRSAVFGACVYGVYNLTNKATLHGYTWTMVAVDTTWGATCFAVIAAVYSATLKHHTT